MMLKMRNKTEWNRSIPRPEMAALFLIGCMVAGVIIGLYA